MTFTAEQEPKFPLPSQGDTLLSPGSHVVPSVQSEVTHLQHMGIDVRYADVHSEHEPTPDEASSIADEIATLEQATLMGINTTGKNPNLLYDKETYAGMSDGWGGVRMCAAALDPIYRGSTIATFGEGFRPDLYRTARVLSDPSQGPEKFTAAEYLYAKRPRKAEVILDNYEKFLAGQMDDNTRRILTGSMDARGVNTRAIAGTSRVVEHFAKDGNVRDDLVVCSLACGAARPVANMVNELERSGQGVRKLILADMDPMALVTADAIIQQTNVH